MTVVPHFQSSFLKPTKKKKEEKTNAKSKRRKKITKREN
jgi:hypothetical protein